MTDTAVRPAKISAGFLSGRNIEGLIARGFMYVLAIAGCAACAFIPRSHYTPDVPADQAVFAKCSGYRPVATRAKTAIAGVLAFTSIGRRDERWYVELYFTVPSGKVVQLLSDHVAYASGLDRVHGIGAFPYVSLTDSPMWSSYINPALRDSLFAVREPMVGEHVIVKPDGRTPFGFDRNFWLAAYIDPIPDKDLWVTLPAFKVNGTEYSIPEIHFKRESGVAVSLRCG
ncbi:MAG: hypothetical protein LH481_09435 [Burkholderiales bacterium]|nr:hypothetical protein [Burkholderiales bacterium]